MQPKKVGSSDFSTFTDNFFSLILHACYALHKPDDMRQNTVSNQGDIINVSTSKYS